MTKEEKQKAIDALKISVPIKALTQEEFNSYIQTLNQVMDWLEQEPFINKPCVSSGVCEHDKNKVLDKIRAEIDAIYKEDMECDGCSDMGMVLDIIDRYKTESEGEE